MRTSAYRHVAPNARKQLAWPEPVNSATSPSSADDDDFAEAFKAMCTVESKVYLGLRIPPPPMKSLTYRSYPNLVTEVELFVSNLSNHPYAKQDIQPNSHLHVMSSKDCALWEKLSDGESHRFSISQQRVGECKGKILKAENVSHALELNEDFMGVSLELTRKRIWRIVFWFRVPQSELHVEEIQRAFKLRLKKGEIVSHSVKNRTQGGFSHAT